MENREDASLKPTGSSVPLKLRMLRTGLIAGVISFVVVSITIILKRRALTHGSPDTTLPESWETKPEETD
jgi:hypothetical protein